jgi:hypothetical protein
VFVKQTPTRILSISSPNVKKLASPATLNALIEALAVFVLQLIAFRLLFDSDILPLGADGAFHFQLASQLGIGSPWVDISALPFTALGEAGPDHHWLIHWLQKPLTLAFGSSPGGMALASITWAALVPAILTFILRLHGAPWAWAMACVATWGLYLLPDRLLMFRAQNAAIIMVVVLALLMSSRSYLKVAVFMFFFGHAYQGVVLAGAVGLSALLAHAWIYRALDRPLIGAAVSGFILSLLSSPWVPDNISYFLVMALGRLMTPVNDLSLMGTEWLPLGPATLFKVGLVGHLCLLFSWLLIFTCRQHQPDLDKLKRALLFTLLSSIFLVLYARHWRMGEFYGPLSAVSLGFALALIPPGRSKAIRAVVLAVLIATLAHQWIKHPGNYPPANRYSGQCDYLANNAGEGSFVFNLPWPAFSQLFGCQPGLLYVSGLDGLMLMQGDTEIFNIWYRLGQGKLENIPAEKVIGALHKTNANFMLIGRSQAQVFEWVLATIPGSSLGYADELGFMVKLDRERISERAASDFSSAENRD